MHRYARKVALFCALGMIVSLTAITTVAHAAGSLNVQVGNDLPVGPHCNPAQSFKGCFLSEGTRFLPGEVTVHKGDTMNFNYAGFHTVTLIPANQGADDWRHDNWEGSDKPYSLIIPDTDDGAGQFELNKTAVFPSDPNCGSSSSPCNYDGSAVVNSGFPQGGPSGPPPFSVTINANPGTHFWVLCLLHDQMQMRVDVVPDSQATTTQDDADQAVKDATNHDIGSSNTLLFQMQHPVYHLVNGNRIWQVHAGFDTGHYSLMAMLPSVLHINKGDKVEWHFAGLFKENHSVVFNSKTANQIASGVGSPVCEGDGTTDGPPDNPEAFPFCNDPSKMELAIDPRIFTPSGDGKLTSASDYENSGLEGTGLSDAPFTLRFPKASGRKTPFKYACGLHGGLMLGKVFVR